MIVLSTTTEVLRARLTALAATTNPTFSFAYGDDPSGISSSIGILNGTTNVTLVSSPAASTSRVIRSGLICNGDTAPVTIIIEHFDGTNARQLASIRLPIGYTLSYGDGGFTVSDQSGSKLTGFGTVAAPDFITGAHMRWDSVSGYTVSEFSLWIPGENSIIQSASPITKSSLTLTPSSFYHLYAYLNAGVADIEHSTTSPSTPYFGTARTKTGDTTRRYIGSIRTDTSGNIYAFKHFGATVLYMANIYGPPFLVLNSGNATTPTNIDLSTVVPLVSQQAIVTSINNDPAIAVVLGTSDQGYTLSASAFQGFVNQSNSVLGPINTNSSQVIQYMFRATPTGSFAMRVSGYVLER